MKNHQEKKIHFFDNIKIVYGLIKGKIVEQGSHEDLIKRRGEYARLWRFQKQGLIK